MRQLQHQQKNISVNLSGAGPQSPYFEINPIKVVINLGLTEKVRNATDARRQGEGVNLILRAVGNEADVVFLANEKTVIFNNPLSTGISEFARNSLHFGFSFCMQVTHHKTTECFSVGPNLVF